MSSVGDLVKPAAAGSTCANGAARSQAPRPLVHSRSGGCSSRDAFPRDPRGATTSNTHLVRRSAERQHATSALRRLARSRGLADEHDRRPHPAANRLRPPGHHASHNRHQLVDASGRARQPTARPLLHRQRAAPRAQHRRALPMPSRAPPPPPAAASSTTAKAFFLITTVTAVTTHRRCVVTCTPSWRAKASSTPTTGTSTPSR